MIQPIRFFAEAAEEIEHERRWHRERGSKTD